MFKKKVTKNDMKYINHINYKEGCKIHTILSHRNHNNLLIYGIKSSGKTSLIRCIMEDKKINSFYYELTMHTIGIIEKLEEIVMSYDHYQNEFKYIIIDNFENIKILDQNKLRVLIEKSYKTAKFIIITEKFNKVMDPIRSRCCCLRISFKNITDVRINDKWNNKENCNEERLNDGSEELVEILFTTYQNFSIKKIKEVCLKIKEIDLSITSFLKMILERIIHTNKEYHIKNKSIKEIAYYDTLFVKSYIDVIYLESLLIRLYYIIYHDGSL